MKTRFLLIVLILTTVLLSANPVLAKGQVLFDAGHAQDAGNADWLINGGYSDFAKLLRDHGYQVTDTRQKLSKQLLENYDALIIPEPNSIFEKSEQTAIINFIAQGGGVFFIGNHLDADRNNDGVDPVQVFNQFVGQLGFRFEDANILEANLYAEPVEEGYLEHPVTYKVDEMACWAGTSIEIHDKENIKGLIFFNKWKYSQAALAVGNYQQGKFVAVGDSAIFDDGSGTVAYENLHKGFIKFDHKQLALNVVNWLTDNPKENL